MASTQIIPPRPSQDVQNKVDSELTAMVHRLEAATSRLEDIASSSFPNGESTSGAPAPTTALIAGETSAPAAKAAPKPVESAPPSIEAFDALVANELENWLSLSGMLGDVIGGQVHRERNHTRSSKG